MAWLPVEMLVKQELKQTKMIIYQLLWKGNQLTMANKEGKDIVILLLYDLPHVVNVLGN